MKGTSIGLLIAVTVLLLAIPGVQAKAVATPFTATQVIYAEGDPGRQWTDDEGIHHVRDQIYTLFISGDLDGRGVLYANSDIDTATGDGDGFGIVIFSPVTWGGGTGDFWGRYSGTFTGVLVGTIFVPFFSGEFVGQGRGNSEGMKIMGTIVQLPGVSYALDGIILNPHG